MISFHILPANLAHSDDIFRLIKKFFPYYDTSRQQMEQRLITGKHLYIVAVVGGKVIGFLDAALRKRSVIVYGMAVEENFRSNGIGTALLRNALLQIKRLGINRTYLLVQTTNTTAIQLYLANGFVFRRISKVLVGGREAYLMVRQETD